MAFAAASGAVSLALPRIDSSLPMEEMKTEGADEVIPLVFLKMPRALREIGTLVFEGG